MAEALNEEPQKKLDKLYKIEVKSTDEYKWITLIVKETVKGGCWSIKLTDDDFDGDDVNVKSFYEILPKYIGNNDDPQWKVTQGDSISDDVKLVFGGGDFTFILSATDADDE
mmetsp:Transcript_58091/g.71006  ORF Transcript_58091/g.71006 Transcript_58091/m.71006 type:complete len:112 (-) Transcript_58091:181-516(-)